MYVVAAGGNARSGLKTLQSISREVWQLVSLLSCRKEAVAFALSHEKQPRREAPCLDGGCGRVKLWRKFVHRKHYQAKLLCHQFTANTNVCLCSQQGAEICLCLPWQVMDCNRSTPLEDKVVPEELASSLCSVERMLHQIGSSLAQLVRRGECKNMRSQLDLFTLKARQFGQQCNAVLEWTNCRKWA